jgi:hypothetical protein
MPWFMVDDKLHSHRKAVRAGVQAMGLWVLSGSWSADHLQDGFIPDYMALRIDPDAALHAAELVAAGLWSVAEKDGEQGWLFHEWDEFQPTREAVEAKREAARERMARVRGNQKAGSQEVRANNDGTSQKVRSTPAHPSPSQPGSTPRRSASKPLPADWTPSETHRTYATTHRVDVDREAFKFRNHAAANDRRQANWNAAFTTWLAKAAEWAPTKDAARNPALPEGW